MSGQENFLSALDEELRSLVEACLKEAETCPDTLHWRWGEGVCELRLAATAERPAGRPRILLFARGRDQVYAFFYKPSRLSFSRDRFAYGMMSLHRGSRENVLRLFSDGLDYLISGFHPDRRPRQLARTTAVTIPQF